MGEDTSYKRLPRDRGLAPAPVETKRCKRCMNRRPLAAFPARKHGGQGVAALCQSCLDERYHTELFTCAKCRELKPGEEFFPGLQGSVVRQACRACISAGLKQKREVERIAQGRSRYHILYELDVDAKTARCRECGPTHIYSTGHARGRGWRCGLRSDNKSEEFYAQRSGADHSYESTQWHRIRGVRGDEMRGTCSICGDVPVRWSSGGHFVCGAQRRRRRHADTERRRRRLAKYGLSEQAYNAMLHSQAGVCAICGGEGRVRKDSDGTLYVDHDHVTGEVRGLLCTTCNTGIGQFFDSPVLLHAAITYLRRASQLSA